MQLNIPFADFHGIISVLVPFMLLSTCCLIVSVTVGSCQLKG